MAQNPNNEQDQQAPQAPNVSTHTFMKGMVRDFNESFAPEGTMSYARNAINNSHDGNLGTIGNEAANLKICDLPYPLIGALHIYKDQWTVFTTDDTNCEIGIFVESTGTYTKVVNDPGLGFKRTNLITGACKENFDCTWSAYFEDGLNPSRYINLQNPIYLVKSVSKDACAVITYGPGLDIEALRLSPLLVVPQFTLAKGHTGGSILNGSYQAIIGYMVNEQRVTDYFTPSNVQSLFTHENESGSLEVNILTIDTTFDEFELGLICTINNQVVVKRIGIYSTRQKVVYIDHIPDSNITINLADVQLQTAPYEKADSMYEVNDYLIRTGIYSKFDFNYQPQANNITAKWVAVSYPANYYAKGGNNVGNMRDEIYPYFIQWIYNTGQKSATYHISARASIASDLTNVTGPDAIEVINGGLSQNWQVNNTATITSLANYQLPDGGTIVATGEMGYWESTEVYPVNKPGVWGKLCGKPIRHHKFPDNTLTNHHDQGGQNIIILGVQFSGITAPLDNEGNPIAAIEGYEILRGSREGNKTIVAKGLINNMAEYTIPAGLSTKQGLYPNYPYNDLRTDPFLSATRVTGGCGENKFTPMGTFRQDMFTFHSPETTFKNPFLSEYELKIHGEMSGTVEGNFDVSFQHPRHKLVRTFALLIAGIVGIGEALHKIKGKKTTTTVGPVANNIGIYGVASTIPAGAAATGLYYALNTIIDIIGEVTGLDALATIVGVSDVAGTLVDIVAGQAVGLVPGATASSINISKETTATSEIPFVARVLEGIPTFASYFAKSADEMLTIIRDFSPHQQYGYQYNSHGFYDTYTLPQLNNTRRAILNANYLDQHLQDFTDSYRINNLYRAKTVVLQLSDNLSNPKSIDNTRQTIGNQNLFKDPTTPFATNTSAYYASLKIEAPDQYGQLENIIQLPIAGSYATAPINGHAITSSVLFGGDTYINRYTEKNPFFYFNDWMGIDGKSFPDDFEFDYRLRYNIPYANYWIDTQKYDAAVLANALMTFNFSGDVLPADLAHLDRDQSDCNSKISFIISQAYFYLFNNGIRDFFVESEINLAYRDFGNTDAEQIYQPHLNTDLPSLLRSDILKKGNYHKYDFSLSVSKLYQNTTSWGSLQPHWYDPTVAETCWTYSAKRAIYSLPQHTEGLKDNWRVFLNNNFKDFPGQITAIKQISQQGALIMMQNDAPVMFQGIDTLNTGAGIKLTIGDGGLFSSPMQAVSNGDVSFEYGSTQSKYSISATPNGLYYISVDQGKILEHGGVKSSYFSQPIQDMSSIGNKYWFEKYLPYQLLLDFPQFTLIDNPVIGIGCQSVFDNSYEIMYFMKKDYRLKPEFAGKILYKQDNIFLNGGNKVYLGDPMYFEECSWTISFDQKTKTWISFHDWYPDFVLPGKNHFMTVKDNAIWKHNSRCDLYCNYYGVDYQFELEFISNSGKSVDMVRSLEYVLECYKYAPNCVDKFHEYGFNFDRAIIYNSEQNTGVLKLNAAPANNPFTKLQYPKIGIDGMDILYTKVENKYRFNQFWDNTNNRDELSTRETPMWITHNNGYEREINPKFVNYNKPPLQRKKLRHYFHRILFKRRVSGNIKMILKIADVKLNNSER